MVETIKITTSDGYDLVAQLFLPSGNNKLVVLINGAMAVSQDYYAPYASYLADHGFTVLTYDYRGIGKSRPHHLRGFKAGLLHWADADQNAMHQWLSSQFPNTRRLVVGHSFGGQIAGLTPMYPEVAGWLMVATQSGYWHLWDGLSQLRMLLVWYGLIPVLTRFYGYFPGKQLGMGQDVPSSVALDWAKAGRHPEYLLGLYKDHPLNRFADFNLPIFSYSFSDDNYAPRRAVDNWLSHYPNAQIRRQHLSPSQIGATKIGHFGFFRKQFADSLWAESAEWLKNT